MYVMEGSTLGGQLIARHVKQALHLPDGCGNTFFHGHGDLTGSMWKEFCQMLKTEIPNEQTGAVVASAKSMFQTFGEWMQRNPALIDR